MVEQTIDCCPVCGSDDVFIKGAYCGHSPLFQGRNLGCCKSCQHHFISPMPQEAELQAYNESFFENTQTERPKEGDLHAWHAGVAKLHASYIKQQLHDRKIKADTLLEVGPGMGLFAEALDKIWPDIDYVALETDTRCYEHLVESGMVAYSDGKDLAKRGKQFDIVVGSNVMEHVPDPVVFLNQLAANLNPSGVIFIEIPCRDHEFKDGWESHLQFFDKLSVRALCSRAGLKLLEIQYCGTPLHELRGYLTLWEKCASLLAAQSVLEELEVSELNPQELKMVQQFKAHKINKKPCRWLRFLAQKTTENE
ncbi:MAG: class I SAM-dependent methyltransferase [Verrucomicrobiota bacterium]